MKLFMCESEDNYSNCLFLDVVCYKIYACDVFHELYVPADGPVGSLTSKMLCFEFLKHAAFHLYAFVNDFSR